uniref:Uncharacterized protein n=1 Tax=Arundo donax TaxID=35708 RepID=A0A0A9DP56_ARUDO
MQHQQNKYLVVSVGAITIATASGSMTCCHQDVMIKPKKKMNFLKHFWD